MHPSDETLRAYHDGQLDAAERAAAAAHLAGCVPCHTRQQELVRRAAWAQAHLQTLDLGPAATPPSALLAWNRFTRRRDAAAEKETTMLSVLLSPRLRTAAAACGAVLVLAFAFAFTPVAAWANDFLRLFRVQQVTALPVDTTGLNLFGYDNALAKQISQLLADSITVTRQPARPAAVASAAAASKQAGFTVRLPSSRTDAPAITVQSGMAFQFVANRSRAQGLLNDMGFSRLVLPASLDGAVIKVDVPSAVTAAYGDCPALDAAEGQSSGSPARRMTGCVMMVQMPSPTMEAPADLPMDQLVEMGLQLTGMTAEQAHAYRQTVDWTSTLVLPIPRNGASYQPVSVDGSAGYLIQRPLDDAPQYALVWVKGGIIHAISGIGNGAQVAVTMANSLQ